MYVVKRNGLYQEMNFEKIVQRIKNTCESLALFSVKPHNLAQKVILGLYEGVTTIMLDNLMAETAASMNTVHPDYGKLAAIIAVDNLHKRTSGDFHRVACDLFENVDANTNEHRPLISKSHFEIIVANIKRIETAINYSFDYEYTYFGLKTLERSYLLRIKDKIYERPQDMLMRVAIGIHGENIDDALETYRYLSTNHFIHATPTLFAAGTPQPQLSSCYLMTMAADSIEGIFRTVSDCAAISKTAGGIGISVHDIRARGSTIHGTNGISNGLVPMLRVFNSVARYVDQGGGKRMGSFAIYLEPWHADIMAFLDLKKNHGIEEHRARDLFYGLWIPDLFMQRVKADDVWSLMSPDTCPNLSNVWGEKFNQLYTSYERNSKNIIRQLPARTVWRAIIEAQVETGTPYIMFKDACNRKSNQQNLGTIKGSNLCTEIVQYTRPGEIAVCNLASLALPQFVRNKQFDFKELHKVTAIITRNLNRIIDINHYPVPEARISNLRHRPIGIGVQGLADTFALMGHPYESEEARRLNFQIFEAIYYSALKTSCALAMTDGTYTTYEGSPLSNGKLQYDLWGASSYDLLASMGQCNWDDLCEDIAKYGVRNSLLVAPMPTASTAQILGNNESFEPFTSNMYVRRVLSGEFNILNKHMMRDLIARNLWTKEIREKIIRNRGSIQNIRELPQDIRDLYKTVWEIPISRQIQYAAERGIFIDQSQSFSLFVAKPTYGTLSSIYFSCWDKGLKTCVYYLRTKAAANPIQFTVVNSDRADDSPITIGDNRRSATAATTAAVSAVAAIATNASTSTAAVDNNTKSTTDTSDSSVEFSCINCSS